MTTQAINSGSMPTTAYRSDDFIEEHLSAFFLPEETEEVIKEEKTDEFLEKEETSSGAVVAMISGEVSNADAVEILNMLIHYDKEYEIPIANFIVDMVNAVVQWGLKLWDGIINFFIDVKAAVSEVVELLASLVDWVLEAIRSVVTEVIQPYIEDIKDAIDEYVIFSNLLEIHLSPFILAAGVIPIAEY